MGVLSRDEIRGVWDALKVDVFTTRFFVDPVAVPLVVLFSKIKGMTPNKVSILALISGAIAALMFYKGFFLYGALWYYIFFVFDCIDGKLARFTSTLDSLGGFYDFIIDRVVISAMMFGFIIALIRSEHFYSTMAALVYILIFLLADVLVLKWKESTGGMPNGKKTGQLTGAVSRFCARYKIHFKPGQILSCFVVFIVGPLTGRYLEGLLLGSLFMLFSICANIVIPYLRYVRHKS